MVTKKHTAAIVVVITVIAVALCFLAIGFSGSLKGLLGDGGVTQAYEYQLFDTDELIRIDIQMDEDDWNDMLENAIAEQYYTCDVVINGQKLYHVAIRPKGNTSLSSIAMDPDNNRYSFKLEFDQYVKGQTCFGLDKLVLNNNFGDATNMKEALIYDMFRFLGADASLYNYAVISVNGEYWGIYLALEAVEDSFMLRNYGTQDGELYKPDTMGMEAGDEQEGASQDRPAFENEGASEGGPGGSEGGSREGAAGAESAPAQGDSQEGASAAESAPAQGAPQEGVPAAGGAGEEPGQELPDGSSDGESNGGEMAGFEGEGPGAGDSRGSGTNLNYVDDELDSYAAIWNSEITKTTDSDHRRVVTALKNISEGNDLETYLDLDNILRFMAVHVFAVNMDSLSGNMAHNYYLYEYEGRLNMIPWDYNLTLGGMGMGSNASSMINDAIDTPFSGTRFFDPILENEEYLERYHAYLRQLVEEYVRSGAFDEAYTRIRSQIDELVRTDPNALFSYEQYDQAAKMLYRTIRLRAESIEGQLDGTIPSTDEGQRQDSSSLIDASEIDVSSMGSFNNRGGDMGGGFGNPDSSGESAGREAESAEEAGTVAEQASENEETIAAEVQPAGEFPGARAPGREMSRTAVNETRNKNILIYAVCLGVTVLAVIGAVIFKRRR